MTEFADLSPYRYLAPTPDEIELTVGWINTENPFPTGTVPMEFIDHLWNFCRRAFMQTRGIHECDACAQTRVSRIMDGRRLDRFNDFKFMGEEKTLGSAEIRVFGKDGKIYCAPDLIFHYVFDHNYRPPSEFIEAVINGPHPGSSTYLELAKNYKCRDKWLDKLT